MGEFTRDDIILWKNNATIEVQKYAGMPEATNAWVKLEAILAALLDRQAQWPSDEDVAEKVPDGMAQTKRKPNLPISPLSPEDFCFCGHEVSLQSISGAGSSMGYLGAVTLKIDGEYVRFIRALRR